MKKSFWKYWQCDNLKAWVWLRKGTWTAIHGSVGCNPYLPTPFLMLTDKEIRHIASLARIKIDKKDEEKLQKDLGSILEYIEKLNKADTEGVQPLYQTTGLVDAFRTDEPRGEFKMDESLNEKLIGQAPDKENRFIKVKSILSKK